MKYDSSFEEKTVGDGVASDGSDLGSPAPVLTSTSTPLPEPLPPRVAPISVQDGPVTWHLSTRTEVGQFAVYGHWANARQAVVTKVEPEYVVESRPTNANPTPVVGWNGTMRSGLATNKQGFTGWRGMTSTTAENTYHVGYDAALNFDPAFTGRPITGYGPILKQTQANPLPNGNYGSASGNAAADWLAGLWMLDGTTPRDGGVYFMPPTQLPTPYFIKARNRDGSTALRMDILPLLRQPVSLGTQDGLRRMLGQFTPPFGFNAGTTRNLYSGRQGLANYGREHAFQTSDCLMVLTDSRPVEQKIAFAEGIVQHGINLAGLVAVGERQWASGYGATSSGRKVALVLAALLTGDPWLNEMLAKANEEQLQFVEDLQIGRLTQAAKDQFAGVAGPGSFDNLPVGTADWVGGLSFGQKAFNPEWIAGYRQVWSPGLTPCGVAGFIWPEFRAAWGNEAFFEYYARYLAVEESRGWVGSNSNGLHKLVRYRDFALAHKAAIWGA